MAHPPGAYRGCSLAGLRVRHHRCRRLHHTLVHQRIGCRLRMVHQPGAFPVWDLARQPELAVAVASPPLADPRDLAWLVRSVQQMVYCLPEYPRTIPHPMSA